MRKRHSWNIFEQVVTVAYQISLETNCVEVSCLIKLHDWGPATFFLKQLAALDMVLNTLWATNLVLTIIIQMPVKIQMIIEAVAQRCSVKKVFLEISQNSQQSTCTRVYRPATLFKKMTLVQAFSCEFCEISKGTFFHRISLVAASVISSKWTA